MDLAIRQPTNPMPNQVVRTSDIDIARGVSHDLCNVLCWMNGYLSELREHCGQDGLPLMEEIVHASSELERLTKQLHQVRRA
jgi:hypothetical protein